MEHVKTKRARLKRRQRRVRGKLRGTAERPRMAVSRSLRNLYIQLIDDVEGKTLVALGTKSKAFQSPDGHRRTDLARALGEQLAEAAQAANVKAVVFDRRGFKYTGRIQAVAEGARSKGLQF